jgi:hypothetical protein
MSPGDVLTVTATINLENANGISGSIRVPLEIEVLFVEEAR